VNDYGNRPEIRAGAKIVPEQEGKEVLQVLHATETDRRDRPSWCDKHESAAYGMEREHRIAWAICLDVPFHAEQTVP